jgi:hypothetical protein
MTSSPPPTGPPSTGRQPGLAATVGLYALARLALVALATGLLLLAGVPFVIAVLVGLIVALPLSMVLFRGLRGRLDSALSVARQRRSAERAALRARLRGQGDPASDDAAQRQSDPGQG